MEELAPPDTASGEAETAAGAGTAAAAQAVGPEEGPGTAAGSTWAEQGQSGSTALGEAAEAVSSSTAVEAAAAAVPWGAVPLEGAEPYHQPAASSFLNGKDQRSRNQATKSAARVYTSIEEERNRDKP